MLIKEVKVGSSIFLEQGIDDACEFTGGCDDSLFWGEMFSFFEVIGFEGGVLEDAGHTHEVEGSFQVGVSSFGDSGFPFCFTDEVDGKCFVYVGYGAENPEFFFYRVIYPYGFIGKGDNFFYGDAGFGSACFEYSSPYFSCGWEVGEEGKDSFTFEVDVLDFGEEAVQFLSYLVLEPCVFSCEFFSFSCDGFEFWGGGIREFSSVKEDCFLLDDFPAMVYDGVCKGIFAYVDAYVVHDVLLGFLGVSGRFSFPLILHLHAGFLPNQLMGDREGGDITPFRVHRPKVHGIPSPCFVCVPQVSIMPFKHTHNST